MSGSKVLYLLAYVAAVSVGVHGRVCGTHDCPQRDVRGGHLADAEVYRGNVLCTYSSSASQRANEYACPYDVNDGGLVVEAFDYCNRSLSTCGHAVIGKRQIDAVTGEVTAVAGSVTDVAGAVGAVAGAAGAVEGLVPAVPLKREIEAIAERQLLSGLPIVDPILGGITGGLGGGASSPSALDVVHDAQPAEAEAEARSAAEHDAPATVAGKRQLDGILGTVGGGASGLTGVVGSLPVAGGILSSVEGAAGGARLPAVAGKRQLSGGGLGGVTGVLGGVTAGLGGVTSGLGGGAGGPTDVVGSLPVLGGVVGGASGIVAGPGLPVRSVPEEGAASPESPLIESEEPIPWPTDLPTPVSTGFDFDLPEPTSFIKLAREY